MEPTPPRLPTLSELPHNGRHHFAHCGEWRPIGVAPCPRCPDKCPTCGSWKVTRIPDPVPPALPAPTDRATYPNPRTYGTATDDPRAGKD